MAHRGLPRERVVLVVLVVLGRCARIGAMSRPEDTATRSASAWLREDHRDLAATRILDAVRGMLAEQGVGKLRMQDVAARAGCSRATLYNHFPTRENLLQAYMRRETQHIHQAVHERVHALADPADALIAGMRCMLDQVRNHPAQAEWFATDVVGTASMFAGADPVVAAAAATWIHPILDRAAANDVLRPGTDYAAVVEWINRLAVSFLSFPAPAPRTDAEEDAALRWFLLPALFTT
ncbi:helix-turn-helix domain-containing protein [Streptomyces noursei]|uniref:TetR/AcrR family transcriptional regulator n=1 Tax=Streptomyces noursei TaxID=1971 RepID=UPI003324F61C